MGMICGILKYGGEGGCLFDFCRLVEDEMR
jgi:hypothetical protein